MAPYTIFLMDILLMGIFVLRVFIKDRHFCHDKPENNDTDSDDKNRSGDFHPTGKITLA